MQNDAAHLYIGTRMYDHIVPILYELHWFSQLPTESALKLQSASACTTVSYQLISTGMTGLGPTFESGSECDIMTVGTATPQSSALRLFFIMEQVTIIFSFLSTY